MISRPTTATQRPDPLDGTALVTALRDWGREFGFDHVGVADTDLGADEAKLLAWLAAGRHGAMSYLARHGALRARPAELVPGTIRVISLRMNYLPAGARPPDAVLADPTRGYVARYALGRDYHKLLRRRLARLVDRIRASVGDGFAFRVFTDSAPVLEVALASRAGIGWRGKHTLLLTRDQGSWFFLGEIYTDLPLPVTVPQAAHCGRCRACIDICPTQAIVAPFELDARRCISYLTIEEPGSIPEALRPAIGNRIYGCDDCQLACPWNRFATLATEPDFAPRHGLDDPDLVTLIGWTRAEFERHTEGSAIRRIGHERWSRNVAVAIGNAPPSPALVAALAARADDPSALVREHVRWALDRQCRGPAK